MRSELFSRIIILVALFTVFPLHLFSEGAIGQRGTFQTGLKIGCAPNFLGDRDSIPISKARITLLKSLIVPGWGEHSLGFNKRGYIFNSSDIFLWITYAALRMQANALDKNMLAYATLHAGISPGVKDAVFYTDIGNYNTIYEYNEQKLRYRQVSAVYDESGEYFWAWDSESSRKEFDEIRLKGGVMKRNASFIVGALVVNRIISVFDIIVLTRGKILEQGSDVQAVVFPTNSSITFALTFSF